ncbi:MAG: hypothetical protein Q8P49_01335 [Candidatus Liptonbacteria bacterium]|nr:hypothetical protein [Candidatus Liptonbacteria bacterium]
MENKTPFGVLFISVFVIVIGLGTVGATLFKKQPAPVPVATTTPATPTPPTPYASSTTGYLYKSSYLSLGGRLSLDLYTYKIPDTYDYVCRFRIVDSEGHKYDVDKLLGTDITTGNCNSDSGNDFWHYFGGWADGDKVILPGTTGEIKIIDVKSLSVETYRYDSNSLYFIAVNRSLKYWLFQHDKGGGDYTVLDQSKNVVLSGITSYKGALYDAANDGFVLTAIDQASSSTYSLRLDFLSAGDLKLRNILTTDPFTPAQRGSNPPRLYSKPGEIIYDPGFGGLDIKYFAGPDAKIHIKL